MELSKYLDLLSEGRNKDCRVLAALKLTDIYYFKLRDRVQKAGLNPFLPMNLGGIGYPKVGNIMQGSRRIVRFSVGYAIQFSNYSRDFSLAPNWINKFSFKYEEDFLLYRRKQHDLRDQLKLIDSEKDHITTSDFRDFIRDPTKTFELSPDQLMSYCKAYNINKYLINRLLGYSSLHVREYISQDPWEIKFKSLQGYKDFVSLTCFFGFKPLTKCSISSELDFSLDPSPVIVPGVGPFIKLIKARIKNLSERHGFWSSKVKSLTYEEAYWASFRPRWCRMVSPGVWANYNYGLVTTLSPSTVQIENSTVFLFEDFLEVKERMRIVDLILDFTLT